MNVFIFGLIMFVSGVVTDTLWAFYIQSMAAYERTREQRYLKAAAWWSVGTGVCTLVFVEGVVQNVVVATVWLLGLWLGTYYSTVLKTLFGARYESMPK